jgi:hypothetical protein
MPTAPGGGSERFLKFQRQSIDFGAEVVQKQRETMEALLSVGLDYIEKAKRLTEVKDPEELRTKTTDLWQKAFEVLRQTYGTQLRDCQAAAVRWTELAMKGAV